MLEAFDSLIFRFAHPEFLWILLALPLLAILRGKSGRTASLRFPSVSLAKQVSAFVRRRPGRLLINLRLLVLALLIIALARPQTGETTSEEESSGIDIVLALDVSGSMWAHDFFFKNERTDRLTAVKGVVRDFIEKRENDRIALVAYATDPYLVSPLTLNHEWLNENLERLRIGLIDESRTAIGSALAMSINRLRTRETESRIIILLTDGANNSGAASPLAVAEAAQALGLRVYTIGVGEEGIVPVPARIDDNGQPVRDRNGRILLRNGQSDIDLETLREIADKTSGRFFHARDTDELETIYDEIDQLEKTEIKLSLLTAYNDIFVWPAALALILLLLEQILAHTRFRRLP